MQKFKVTIIVGNLYEVEVVARDILAANNFVLELEEETQMVNLDEVDRKIFSSVLIEDEEPHVLFDERQDY